MTEKYTPDEAELIGCYAGVMEEQAGENYDQAKADAERGIAKIKADALREAARKLFADETAESGTAKAKHNAIYGLWLLDEADRIEGNADEH